MRALIILPTYNERENVSQLVPAILSQDQNFDVLIVDDNSPDGTGAIADSLAADEERIHVLHRPSKAGLGSAYVAGFKFALNQGYDAVFEMDADFSHDPNDLARLLRAVERADVVIGSRWVPGGGTRNWSALRMFISRIGSRYAQIVLGMPMNDLTSGFKCFRRHVLAGLELDAIAANGYAFQVEVNYQCYRLGYRIVELPIVFIDRRVGKSKMSTGIVVEAMAVCLKLRLFGDHFKPGRSSSDPW